MFRGEAERIHWSFDDPAAVVGEAVQRRAFEHVASGLAARLRIWLSLPGVRRRIDQVDAGRSSLD